MMNSWRATSSYKAIRWMYAQKSKDGKPRPVMDQEPHYESTQYVLLSFHAINCHS